MISPLGQPARIIVTPQVLKAIQENRHKGIYAKREGNHWTITCTREGEHFLNISLNAMRRLFTNRTSQYLYGEDVLKNEHFAKAIQLAKAKYKNEGDVGVFAIEIVKPEDDA
jgi:hypothetical protein